MRKRKRLKRWLKYHALEILIGLAIFGVVATVIIGTIIERTKLPCLKYKTVLMSVYNGKTTTLVPTKKCVKRAPKK